MRCPECGARLILQAFWQGRHVNCTRCGARLQRGVSGMVLAAAGGLGAWLLAEWLLGMAGAPMEVEIPVSLLAMGAGYFGVHIATLRLKPREDDTGLRL